MEFKKNNDLFEIDPNMNQDIGIYRTKASTVYILINNFVLGAKKLDLTTMNTTGDYLYYLIRCKNKTKNTSSQWEEVTKEQGLNILNSI